MNRNALRRIVHVTAVVLAVSHAGLVGAGEADDARYRQLVAAAKANPDSVDYVELRAVYAKSSFYKGDASDPASFRVARPTPEVAAAFVEDNFAIFGAHGYLLPLFPKETLAMHIIVSAGLVNAMLKGTRGFTPETAIKVLTVSEEYDVIRLLKFTPKAQTLVQRNGTHYDRIAVTKSDPGAAPVEAELWFDLTDLFAANAARR